MDLKNNDLMVNIFIENTNSNLIKYDKIRHKNYSTSKNIRKLNSLLNNIDADIQWYDNFDNSSQKKKVQGKYIELIALSKFIKERIVFFEKKVDMNNEMTYEDIYGDIDTGSFDYKETIKGIKKYLSINDNLELKHPYNAIFKDSESYNIFLKLHNLYKGKKNNVADYSSIFYAMRNNNFILCRNKDYILFINKEYPTLNFGRIDSKHQHKTLNENNMIITK